MSQILSFGFSPIILRFYRNWTNIWCLQWLPQAAPLPSTCVSVFWGERSVPSANCRLSELFNDTDALSSYRTWGEVRQTTFPIFLVFHCMSWLIRFEMWKAKHSSEVFFKAVDLKLFHSWGFSSLALFWIIEIIFCTLIPLPCLQKPNGNEKGHNLNTGKILRTFRGLKKKPTKFKNSLILYFTLM